jgi:hypothetical protein
MAISGMMHTVLIMLNQKGGANVVTHGKTSSCIAQAALYLTQWQYCVKSHVSVL